MSKYDELCEELRRQPRSWLVTGAAGFIGSNLVEKLLSLGQSVVGLDDLSTGHRSNLELVKRAVGDSAYSGFRFVEGTICDSSVCAEAVKGVDLVLHQAALGSVPRSIKDPVRSYEVNVGGFLQMMLACRDAGIRRFVYASSSSVYGDHPGLPKKEELVGQPLSPYAATKASNELLAASFGSVYEMSSIGLRYFNVFGPRQDPNGAYAAVIPKWIALLCQGEACELYGDGLTSRDFCYIDNVVQANLLAALAADEAGNTAYNIALGGRTTLLDLYEQIRLRLGEQHGVDAAQAPVMKEERAGDVKHSHADISKAQQQLGYAPQVSFAEGIARTVDWFAAPAEARVER